MKSKIWVLFFVLFGITALFGQSFSDALAEETTLPTELGAFVQALKDHKVRLTPAAQKMIQEGLKNELRKHFRDHPESRSLTIPRDVDQFSRDLSKLSASYQDQRNTALLGHQVLSANNELVKGVLDVGIVTSAASGAGLPISLGLTGIKAGMDILLDVTVAKFDESALNSARNLLTSHFRQLPQQAWGEWDQLTQLPPEQG